MQKYLSPTDRDEIALSLNLTNAQVITWFQVSKNQRLDRVQQMMHDTTSRDANIPQSGAPNCARFKNIRIGGPN